MIADKVKGDLYAIYSIWLREMLRFFRLKSRLFGSVASPFFFLAFLGIGFNNIGRIPGIPEGVNYMSFLTPGIIGMTLLFSAGVDYVQGDFLAPAGPDMTYDFS